MNLLRPRPNPVRAAAPFATLALAVMVAACGSGLGSSEWLWCKENLAAVDAAADQLGFAKTPAGYDQPTWWPDYVTSSLLSSTAVLTANPDFVAACDRAATKVGLVESQTFWCLEDGLEETWAASVELGTVAHVDGDAFAYQVLPLDKRIDNADFIRACETAFAARTN